MHTPNVIPGEFFDLASGYCCCFHFNPLGEVIDGNNQKFHLPLSLWEGTGDVDSPLVEWTSKTGGCYLAECICFFVFTPWHLFDGELRKAADERSGLF
ncbi:hypothetical protein Tco_0016464 [Tanacetum coccineum]